MMLLLVLLLSLLVLLFVVAASGCYVVIGVVGIGTVCIWLSVVVLRVVGDGY